MFENILVPLDGSELAASILPQVVELCQKCNSRLTLLHVCRPEETGESAPSRPAVFPDEQRLCEAYLALIGKDLQGQGIEVAWACVKGIPAKAIIDYADQHKMDLIALATHGKGEVAWLLGSTAEKVVTHATVPVMLFRILYREPPLLKGQLKEFI
ncbi:MAG: universal stress protein [Deltaproteobacteria bacterium]|nr:universal stress protein [Deltaproteobacteria bacterium]